MSRLEDINNERTTLWNRGVRYGVDDCLMEISATLAMICDKMGEKKTTAESDSENPNKWIPVSERLPRIADVYRVTRYYPNNVMNPIYLVDACCFDGFDTWYDDNRINHERAYADNVIAWQENPEPYKPEKGE